MTFYNIQYRRFDAITLPRPIQLDQSIVLQNLRLLSAYKLTIQLSRGARIEHEISHTFYQHEAFSAAYGPILLTYDAKPCPNEQILQYELHAPAISIQQTHQIQRYSALLLSGDVAVPLSASGQIYIDPTNLRLKQSAHLFDTNFPFPGVDLFINKENDLRLPSLKPQIYQLIAVMSEYQLQEKREDPQFIAYLGQFLQLVWPQTNLLKPKVEELFKQFVKYAKSHQLMHKDPTVELTMGRLDMKTIKYQLSCIGQRRGILLRIGSMQPQIRDRQVIESQAMVIGGTSRQLVVLEDKATTQIEDCTITTEIFIKQKPTLINSVVLKQEEIEEIEAVNPVQPEQEQVTVIETAKQRDLGASSKMRVTQRPMRPINEMLMMDSIKKYDDLETSGTQTDTMHDSQKLKEDEKIQHDLKIQDMKLSHADGFNAWQEPEANVISKPVDNNLSAKESHEVPKNTSAPHSDHVTTMPIPMIMGTSSEMAAAGSNLTGGSTIPQILSNAPSLDHAVNNASHSKLKSAKKAIDEIQQDQIQQPLKKEPSTTKLENAKDAVLKPRSRAPSGGKPQPQQQQLAVPQILPSKSGRESDSLDDEVMGQYQKAEKHLALPGVLGNLSSHADRDEHNDVKQDKQFIAAELKPPAMPEKRPISTKRDVVTAIREAAAAALTVSGVSAEVVHQQNVQGMDREDEHQKDKEDDGREEPHSGANPQHNAEQYEEASVQNEHHLDSYKQHHQQPEDKIEHVAKEASDDKQDDKVEQPSYQHHEHEADAQIEPHHEIKQQNHTDMQNHSQLDVQTDRTSKVSEDQRIEDYVFGQPGADEAKVEFNPIFQQAIAEDEHVAEDDVNADLQSDHQHDEGENQVDDQHIESDKDVEHNIINDEVDHTHNDPAHDLNDVFGQMMGIASSVELISSAQQEENEKKVVENYEKPPNTLDDQLNDIDSKNQIEDAPYPLGAPVDVQGGEQHKDWAAASDLQESNLTLNQQSLVSPSALEASASTDLQWQQQVADNADQQIEQVLAMSSKLAHNVEVEHNEQDQVEQDHPQDPKSHVLLSPLDQPFEHDEQLKDEKKSQLSHVVRLDEHDLVEPEQAQKPDNVEENVLKDGETESHKEENQDDEYYSDNDEQDKVAKPNIVNTVEEAPKVHSKLIVAHSEEASMEGQTKELQSQQNVDRQNGEGNNSEDQQFLDEDHDDQRTNSVIQHARSSSPDSIIDEGSNRSVVQQEVSKTAKSSAPAYEEKHEDSYQHAIEQKDQHQPNDIQHEHLEENLNQNPNHQKPKQVQGQIVEADIEEQPEDEIPPQVDLQNGQPIKTTPKPIRPDLRTVASSDDLFYIDEESSVPQNVFRFSQAPPVEINPDADDLQLPKSVMLTPKQLTKQVQNFEPDEELYEQYAGVSPKKFILTGDLQFQEEEAAKDVAETSTQTPKQKYEKRVEKMRTERLVSTEPKKKKAQMTEKALQTGDDEVHSVKVVAVQKTGENEELMESDEMPKKPPTINIRRLNSKRQKVDPTTNLTPHDEDQSELAREIQKQLVNGQEMESTNDHQNQSTETEPDSKQVSPKRLPVVSIIEQMKKFHKDKAQKELARIQEEERVQALKKSQLDAKQQLKKQEKEFKKMQELMEQELLQAEQERIDRERATKLKQLNLKKRKETEQELEEYRKSVDMQVNKEIEKIQDEAGREQQLLEEQLKLSARRYWKMTLGNKLKVIKHDRK